MNKVDTVIIGAGVIGLAIAERLSRHTADVVVLERHDSFGRETSSRNSEVIHAGFYYPTDSLKARLCVEGNRLMYEFCSRESIPHKQIGKIVVARTREEEEKVGLLFNRGTSNGVPGLELLDRNRIAALEPAIPGYFGMLSTMTGILDTHSLMQRLERKATANGATFAYNCEVLGLSRENDCYTIRMRDADGEELSLQSARVINAAGLSSDKVAALAGIDPAKTGDRIFYCKGEYFSVSNRHRGKVSHLVYPAPTPISLGIHGVLGLDGSFKLGPSAFYVDTLDYTVDSAHRSVFYESARTLFPFLEEEDLTPAMAGIRPKLHPAEGGFRDFVIREESGAGLPGFVNLIGMESPALTSALAIAGYVERLLKK
jgi:L-2-hydroxyglutarate oxidase LhgO